MQVSRRGSGKVGGCLSGISHLRRPKEMLPLEV
jgi:hypothetical protein